MKKNNIEKILDKIFTIVTIILAIVVIITMISEFIANCKVIRQDNCITLNGKDYCEVE